MGRGERARREEIAPLRLSNRANGAWRVWFMGYGHMGVVQGRRDECQCAKSQVNGGRSHESQSSEWNLSGSIKTQEVWEMNGVSGVWLH